MYTLFDNVTIFESENQVIFSSSKYGGRMYKIWFNGKLICLMHHRLDTFSQEHDKLTLTVHYTGKTKFILSIFDKLAKSEVDTCYILSNDVKKLRGDFFSLFNIVEAAGGLVFNSKKEVLLIYRRGSWDLPKGKLENNEKKKKGAVREVVEETGLKKVTLIDKLITTYHTYGSDKGNKKRSLKPTYWYLMHSDDTDLVPQYEEDIEKVAWVNVLTKGKRDLEPIFPNIMSVIDQYKQYVDKV